MRYETKKELREKFARKERLSKIWRKRATIVPYQEKAIEILEKKGIHCVREKRILTAHSFYLVDIYLPEHNMIIELDGWTHDTPGQALKDEKRDHWLKMNGYLVLRMKNHEVNKGFWQKINGSIKYRARFFEKYGTYTPKKTLGISTP